jgi:two-component system, cell cycle response regulator
MQATPDRLSGPLASRRPSGPVARVGAAVTAALFAAVAAQLEFHLGGPAVDRLFDNWLYDGVGVAAGLTCVLRGLVARERSWLFVGLGVLAWTAGDIYWTAALETVKSPPYPSLADAGYLGFYPLVFVGLGLLVRARLLRFSASVWLDGVIAACAVGAVASGIVLADVWHSSTGGAAAVATNMAYPAGDALLLCLVVAAFAFSGWSVDRMWLLLAAGIVVFGIADSIYLVQVANGSYQLGTALDLGWPAGFALIAVASCAPARGLARTQFEGRRVLVAPLVLAAVCLGVEVEDHFVRVGTLSVLLASIGLIAVIGRLALTFNEHLKLLLASRAESLTDQLTELSNRRALIGVLEDVFSVADGPSRLLVLFDLDGFKAYNDAFGHEAGDMLLKRLGSRLRRTVEARGEAFRLGGDEFCILLEGELIDLEWVRAAASASLRESGEGFVITCSSGYVLIPGEAGDPSEALRIADRRMYAEKGNRLHGLDSSGVLMQALFERDRYLGEHSRGVVDYATALARHAGLTGKEEKLVRAAAELHDVGKLALPEAVLAKAEPLDNDEWALIYQHTVVGERIVGAAHGLGEVARTIRSTHERWDGTGYPDRLAGEDIPYAARLIAICDAFDAMTTTRPYAAALTPQEAVDELVRNAGTQFDPALVTLFVHAVADSSPPLARTPPGSAAAG